MSMFSMGQAYDYFERRTAEALATVEREQLSALEAGLDEIVDRIVQRFVLSRIELGEYHADTEEVTVRANRFSGAGFYAPGQDVNRPGTRVTISVPFTGSSELLLYQPQAFDIAPVEAVVQNDTVVIVRDFVDPQTDQVRAWRDQELERLKSRVSNANNGVPGFNNQLTARVSQAAAQRRSRLRDQNSLRDDLNNS
jgi:hypothetical protein